MNPDLLKATLGAPAGLADPTINALNAPGFQATENQFAVAGDSFNTGVTVANNKAAQEAALREQEIKSDPSKFQRVKREDGGYGFYDGVGEEISAYEYANALGKAPADVLADSENPIDLGYQQDFQNLNDYLEAKLNSKFSDEDKQFAEQIENQVREQQGVDLGKLNIDDVIKRFKEAYPTVYGLKKRGVEAGSTLLPYQSSSSTETDPTIAAFQQALQGQ